MAAELRDDEDVAGWGGAMASFKAVFNRGRGELDPSSPHARNAALLPFLLHAYACSHTGSHLQILASDFHSNTWHAQLTLPFLRELKENLGCASTPLAFLQNISEAFSSDTVKVELGGPASAIGGKGATSAKLKSTYTDGGNSRDLVLQLEMLKGRSASDAVGALALELYDAFIEARRQVLELEASVVCEKHRSTNVLNAILQGKADSIHFRQNTLPNMTHSEIQPSWSNTSSPNILMPTQSHVPCVSLNMDLSPSMPTSMPPGSSDYSPGYNVTAIGKPYMVCRGTAPRKQKSSRNTALTLSGENSYSRTAKRTDKRTKCTVESDTDEGGLPASNVFVPTSCDGHAEGCDLESGNRKFRELDADLLMKIDAGGENRSAKTDAWARRHYTEWRRSCGLPEREIEDLSLPEFAESLVKFFCMVKKRNGDLFPSESLKGMYRGFARIIQSHYKRLSLQGSYNGPIVDAGKDIIFEKARISCIEAMKHSLLQGAGGIKRRRLDELELTYPIDILACSENQMDTPKGLCRRLCYYAIHKFGINSNMELYDTTDVEFQKIVNDEGDVYWEYDEKRAQKCKRKEIFHDVIQCGEKDVVECIDKYFMHLPPKPLEDEPRRLFLAPINRPTTDIWYRHQNISSRTLLDWFKDMGPLSTGQPRAMKASVNDSASFLRCQRTCSEKERSPDSNLHPPEIAIRGQHVLVVEEADGNTASGNIAGLSSNADEETNEGQIGESQEDLTDMDSHD